MFQIKPLSFIPCRPVEARKKEFAKESSVFHGGWNKYSDIIVIQKPTVVSCIAWGFVVVLCAPSCWTGSHSFHIVASRVEHGWAHAVIRYRSHSGWICAPPVLFNREVNTEAASLHSACSMEWSLGSRYGKYGVESG